MAHSLHWPRFGSFRPLDYTEEIPHSFRDRINNWLPLLFYAAILFTVLSRTPIWLDELLQLRGTRDHTFAETLQWAFQNAGGVPLPYLTQKLVLDAFGYSTFVARLPAAVFSILSGAAFLVLSWQMKLPAPRVALLIFLFVPLQFRYGTEARGYSGGLFFCVASFCMLMRLRTRVDARYVILYWLSLVLGLYSQPLSFLIAAGQGAWALVSQAGVRFKLTVAAAIGAAGLSFLPWVLVERHLQSQFGTMGAFWFSADQLSRFAFVRELAGDGYLCSIPLLLLAAAGLRSGSMQPVVRSLLAATALAGLAGPMLTDALANYFFASRQLIFAIPPLAALASVGAYDLWRNGQRLVSAVLVTALTVGATMRDYRQATTPVEDWEAAADAIVHRLQQNGCVQPAPPDHINFYAFFRPGLRPRECTPATYADRIVTVTSPYTGPDDTRALLDTLLPRYVKTDETVVSRFRIAVYERR